MKINNIFAFLLVSLPMSVFGATKGVDITVQKKHSVVVDKAVELYSRDMRSNDSKDVSDVQVYQLDMASNKDMKALGSLQVPVLDFITKRDAYWLGERKGKTIVVGSNGRGTAYALMQLSSMGGKLDRKFETTQAPSVEFRGFSIEYTNLKANDFHRLFEQMLRMRANTLCAGFDDDDYRLHITKNLRQEADSFGIDLATKHDNELKLHGHKRDAISVDVLWEDDGYGYMKPVKDDDNGGAVYHLSHKGNPHDYLWLAATQPGLISNEMLTAYRNGGSRLWMLALKDLNIGAYPLNLFMDLAWDVDTLNNGGVQQHLKNWLKRNYGDNVADAAIEPLMQYYKLVGICRPEFIDKSEFNAEEFGNELERYLNDYRNLGKKINATENLVDESRKDDYFAKVEYPVLSSGLYADKILQAQESKLIGRKPSFHHDDEALESAARSMKAFWEIRSLTTQYNDNVSKLCWNKPISDRLDVFKEPVLTDTVSVAEVEKYYNSEPVYAPFTNDDCIVNNASEYSSVSGDVKTVDMLGHSMKAVELQKDDEVSYRFYSDGIGGVLRLAFVPVYSVDGGSSQCTVSIDGSTPTTIIVNDGSASSKRWEQGVLRGQSLITLPASLSSGMHTLTIKALNDHVVFDQWMVDRDVDREFYVFPVK